MLALRARRLLRALQLNVGVRRHASRSRPMVLDVWHESLGFLGSHRVSALARSSWPDICAAGSTFDEESLCDHVPRSQGSVRRGLARGGLATPPAAYGLPSNDALQLTRALWNAASPRFMI